MNKNDDSSLNENEDDLRETIALIQRMEPTLAARIKNRKVIATELARIEQHTLSNPWWKRSVSVPVPVALGMCTAFLVVALAWLPSLGDASVESDSITGSTSIEHRDPSGIIRTPSEMSEFNVGQMDFRASETYLCGIGRIQYESVYQFQEN